MFIAILTAFCVVVSIGLFFGILLALFNHFFGIEDDPTVKAVRAVLPGLNCGACGFKGCNEYAAALARNEAAPSLCIPGAETTASELSAVLGVEVAPPKDVIAFIRCNGTCEAAVNKAVFNGIRTCKAQNALFAGPKSCSYGCLGCGDCAAACVANAIDVFVGMSGADFPGKSFTRIAYSVKIFVRVLGTSRFKLRAA